MRYLHCGGSIRATGLTPCSVSRPPPLLLALCNQPAAAPDSFFPPGSVTPIPRACLTPLPRRSLQPLAALNSFPLSLLAFAASAPTTSKTHSHPPSPAKTPSPAPLPTTSPMPRSTPSPMPSSMPSHPCRVVALRHFPTHVTFSSTCLLYDPIQRPVSRGRARHLARAPTSERGVCSKRLTILQLQTGSLSMCLNNLDDDSSETLILTKSSLGG